MMLDHNVYNFNVSGEELEGVGSWPPAYGSIWGPRRASASGQAACPSSMDFRDQGAAWLAERKRGGTDLLRRGVTWLIGG